MVFGSSRCFPLWGSTRFESSLEQGRFSYVEFLRTAYQTHLPRPRALGLPDGCLISASKETLRPLAWDNLFIDRAVQSHRLNLPNRLP